MKTSAKYFGLEVGP